MKKILPWVFVLILILISHIDGMSQSRWKPYINTGYITNLKKSDGVTKADAGGSIRIGLLNKGLFGKGRLGFYGGYVWFKEYHIDDVGYDDRGNILMAGMDFCLIRKENMEWYIKLGLGSEKYISTYPNNTSEFERSIKPDFGFLFNYKNFNAYLGWQPSDPDHINIGIGFTLDRSLNSSDSNY